MVEVCRKGSQYYTWMLDGPAWSSLPTGEIKGTSGLIEKVIDINVGSLIQNTCLFENVIRKDLFYISRERINLSKKSFLTSLKPKILLDHSI